MSTIVTALRIRFKKELLTLTCGLWLLQLGTPFSQAQVNSLQAVDSGRELAQRVYDRLEAKDATSQALMVLSRKGQKSRNRTLYSYAKDKGQSERWTLLRFIEPNDISGTGLLTLDFKGDESTQWLYLPALDRVRRISSSRRGGHFVGSDFYYEDLMDREVDMDRHTLMGTERIGEIECTVLESVPTQADNSVYSKRVSWIDPGTLIPLKVDLYTKGKSGPTKRLIADKIEQVQGHWTVFESTMQDLESGGQTQLLTTSIIYDQELPDELFTQRTLEDERREVAFRP